MLLSKQFVSYIIPATNLELSQYTLSIVHYSGTLPRDSNDLFAVKCNCEKWSVSGCHASEILPEHELKSDDKSTSKGEVYVLTKILLLLRTSNRA